MSNTSHRPWRPILGAPEAAETLSVVRTMVSRLREPSRAIAAAAAAKAQTQYPKSTQWRPHSIAQGHAGVALLFGAVDACGLVGEGDLAGHRHLECAARATE